MENGERYSLKIPTYCQLACSLPNLFIAVFNNNDNNSHFLGIYVTTDQTTRTECILPNQYHQSE